MSQLLFSRNNALFHIVLRAGLVENAKDYLYSSEKDYASKKGLIKLDMW
jgi:hypothetical protein